MDTREKVICLVTIHGIGFQQPPIVGNTPDTGVDGYADNLHRHLSDFLGPLLGDDPTRQRDGRRPIYVQNHPPTDLSIDAWGPDRLGIWEAAGSRAVVADGTPLVTKDGTARVAHIALVYSDLEGRSARVGSALETAAMSLVSLGHYASFGGLIHMLAGDISALGKDSSPASSLAHMFTHLLPGHPDAPPATPSLRVRTDAGAPTASRASTHQDISGLLATVRQLENDVAAYVCRNDLRTRVHGFVRDALCRLAYRQDVGAIVINSHSNGTPIAYDVLHELTPNAMQSVRALVTAGSPLRKYADLFTWGTEIGNIAQITPLAGYTSWLNFWDARDPVADPLVPDASWRPGQSPEAVPSGLFHQGDHTGDPNAVIRPASLKDYLVDNVQSTGGTGLRAHNYWDNKGEFVDPLHKLLRQCLTEVGAGGSA